MAVAAGHHSTAPFVAAFAGNTLIAVAKFVAAAFTGSSAMISEGVHSVVDASNNVLMLFGIRRSRVEASREHPFGHGKELYFWSLIVAVVIFGVGGGISAYEGILHLLDPAPLEAPLWNHVVLGFAFVVDGVTLVIAYREFAPHLNGRSLWEAVRASKDPTKFTVVLEDGAATLGVLVAAAGVAATQITGNGAYDGAASVLIGLLLCATAVVLAIESKHLLLGESADPTVVSSLERIVRDDRDVDDLAQVLTMHLGPYELLVNVDVDFRDGLSGDETVTAIGRIERSIRDRHPEVKRIYVEARNLDARRDSGERGR